MINYSFIIPHHNSPILLYRCLDSIPQREDMEIIVVDDNSDADKKPLLNRPDVKLICIDAEHTKGAGRARNYGLKEAVGKWLVFADADDFFSHDFLNVLDKYRDEDCDVIYHNAKVVDTITLLPIKGYLDNAISIISKYDGSSERECEVRYRLNAPWWKIVKRELVEKNHIQFEEVPKGNDIFFSIQVGYFAKKIIVIDVPLYVYTFNRNSISNKKKDEEVYFSELCTRKRLLGFYNLIGHPEWIISKTRLCLRILRHDGLFVLFRTIKKCLLNRKYIIHSVNDYVDIIHNNEKNSAIC